MFKMVHNSQFLQDFMAGYSYPEEAINEFTRVLQRLDDDPLFGGEIDRLVKGYMIDETITLNEALESVKALGEKYGENEYTLDFIFMLCCVPKLKANYDEAGISEEIFRDSLDDFRCKLLECMECEEVPGTFVADWNDWTFKLKRFAYGRFQYEVRVYNWEKDFTFACGKVLHPGDIYVNFHIPSSGVPITDEVRFASYMEAYGHFKHLFPDGKVVFGCGSWLLYPRHREFLPKNSNILKFMDDFEIVGSAEKEGFPNGWRIFGKASDLPYEELPRDTSLRRAYAEWLTAGNKAGDAFGLFLFDGDKIVRGE